MSFIQGRVCKTAQRISKKNKKILKFSPGFEPLPISLNAKDAYAVPR